jgi:hypothetical protein
VSSLGTADARRAERRWTAIGVTVVSAIVLGQVLGGLAREATTHESSHLEKVQTCLTERSTPYEPVVGDAVALSAERGALRTSIGGNAVTVALGGSEKDAERVFDAYTAVATADVVASRLERRRKVVFLWDAPPSAAQRDFMILCTLDAQD